MPQPRKRRPADRRDGVRSSITGPDPMALDRLEDEAIDLRAVYDESVTEVDPDWLERYGEADWYAAITLFGLFHVPDDYRPEDIPEEYRWPGPSRRDRAPRADSSGPEDAA